MGTHRLFRAHSKTSRIIFHLRAPVTLVSMLRATTSSVAASASAIPVRSSQASMTASSLLRQTARSRLVLQQQQTAQLRQASTSAGQSTSSASTKASQHKGKIEAVTMPWDQYFKLRKGRRTWGTVAAVPTTVTGVVLGGGYFANLETDPDTMILGVEPIYAYGVAVIGCVALGWLSGPILGNALWRAPPRSVLEPMERMDSVFLRHVQRMRVDPSRQSVNNPVPDYYGEHIYSKKQYRQWLRDQAAYRRKATFGSDSEGTAAV